METFRNINIKILKIDGDMLDNLTNHNRKTHPENLQNRQAIREEQKYFFGNFSL